MVNWSAGLYQLATGLLPYLQVTNWLLRRCYTCISLSWSYGTTGHKRYSRMDQISYLTANYFFQHICIYPSCTGSAWYRYIDY